MANHRANDSPHREAVPSHNRLERRLEGPIDIHPDVTDGFG
jgi:hypothetical protein